MVRPFEGALGIFDSGVGGLTVVDAILRICPNECILYVADQTHVPYGGRPLEEVHGFATGISKFLANQGCRAIVMACNISSAVALRSVERSLAPLPVVGMIGPASARAVQNLGQAQLQLQAESPVIGVLATEGTVNSGAYVFIINCCDPRAAIAQVPCPRFVPLVEEGRTESEDAMDAAREYLQLLAKLGCRKIILGCTHYPYLLPVLRRVSEELFSEPVEFIDPAREAAAWLNEHDMLVSTSVEADPASARSLLLTTGNADTFRCQAPRFLPGVSIPIGVARWEEGRLALGAQPSALGESLAP